MKITFEPGDRVIHNPNLFACHDDRPGTFIAGPGEHETDRPGNSLVIGAGYALVQFDDGRSGSQFVRLDNLKPEGQ